MKTTKPHQILIVDDSPLMIKLMGRILSGLGQLRFATSGEAALRLLREAPADLVLLDSEMPGMKGFEVCQRLKADPALCEIPVIFVTAHTDPEFELKCLEAGAADFLSKPISEALLVARAKSQLRIKQLTDELRMIASIDVLTNISNRRSFNEALQREWRRGVRNNEPISLLMVDVDHFKLFNDRYGHPAGDSCLRMVAQALGSTLRRGTDMLARYGGEEFVLLLPDTSLAGATQIAEQALEAVRALGIPHEASPTAPCVTCSIGLAWYEHGRMPAPPDDATPRDAPAPLSEEDLLKAADLALYRAKATGRNQTCPQELTPALRLAPGGAASSAQHATSGTP